MENKIFNPIDFFFRVFPAIAGGFLGAGIFLLVFLLLQGLLFVSVENEAFPVFAVLAISFSGSISANIFAAFFVLLANSDKYPKKRPILVNTLIITVLLYLVSILFIITSKNILAVVGLFFIFSIVASLIFMELYKEHFSIGGVHGALVGGFLLSTVFTKLFESGDGSTLVIILIFLLPFAWFFIASFQIAGEVVLALIKRQNSE